MSCCGGTPTQEATGSREGSSAEKGDDPRTEIRKAYGGLAKRSRESASSCSCSGESCCGGDEDGKYSVTEQAGYSREQLESLPTEAQAASAGCGNPTAIAGLGEGEVVLDLGSGGGIDVFLAAKRVGPSGRVIGVDMTPEMIDLARQNARKVGAGNVEFRLGEIEHLPIEDGIVDVIISNCVINLSPEKEAVFKEAYRVLRSGGRLLVSDMMVQGLPDEVRKNVTTWASCIGGAIKLEDYLAKIREAGFTKLEVLKNDEYSRQLVTDSLDSFIKGLSEEDQTAVRSLADKTKDSLSISHADIKAVKP
jgi:arsenite methyltransferase